MFSFITSNISAQHIYCRVQEQSTAALCSYQNKFLSTDSLLGTQLMVNSFAFSYSSLWTSSFLSSDLLVGLWCLCVCCFLDHRKSRTSLKSQGFCLISICPSSFESKTQPKIHSLLQPITGSLQVVPSLLWLLPFVCALPGSSFSGGPCVTLAVHAFVSLQQCVMYR